MRQDITVVVRVGGKDYQARVLNVGGVEIYDGDALVGAGTWDDGRIIARTPTLDDAVYEVVAEALNAELSRPV